MTVFWAVILLGVLIFVHELGHFLCAKLMKVKVLKFSLGFGPRLIGKRYGDTEYLVSAFPLGGYVKMLGEDAEDTIPEEEKARSFSAQTVGRKALIVLSGPLFNIALTFLIFVFILALGSSVPVPVLGKILPVVDEVQEGYPAQEAGFRRGDVIIRVNETSIDTWFDMVSIVAKNPGKQLVIEVKRDGSILSLTVTPRSVEETGSDGRKIIIGRIGLKKVGGGFFENIQSTSLLDVPVKGLVATYRMGELVVDTIQMFFTGRLSPKNIGGPIMIVSESGRAASSGIFPFLLFMAMISINLGILNLLPIPVLDGGHILFFAVEAVRGKPLSERTIIIAQRLGLVMLVMLMVLAFYNDIMRLFAGKLFTE